ncbi:MAG: carbohydrate ABC transporter permease [Dactylosporangium sp.]|nr:carbohydrate ABC transporter permease [Dactylosporangium sp.]NNJ63876.1 carbohydrate ABC transporter permease [Dactylosporangium sp.]
MAAPDPGGDSDRDSRSSGGSVFRGGPLTYLTLTLGALLSTVPLYWMLVVASRTTDAVNDVPPVFIPGGRLGENVNRVLEDPNASFLTGLINSIIVSSVVTVTTVLFGSLAGFAFAKLRFRGKNALLLFILATMMVPIQLGVIPLLILMTKLEWQSQLQSVIVPFMVSGFAVFLMRQYASEAVPDELIEAARVDGCATLRIYWNIVLPALRPAAAVLGLLTFMQTWNEFFWPCVVLQDTRNPTVQISLRMLNLTFYADYSLVFAGTAMAIVPLLLVFVLFGKQIIGGIMEGAVKA